MVDPAQGPQLRQKASRNFYFAVGEKASTGGTSRRVGAGECLKLIDQDRVEWKGRAQFYSVASHAIRRILVDHARGKQRLKRGGDAVRVTMGNSDGAASGRDVDVLDLDRALVDLEREDELDHSIVMLRFFPVERMRQRSTRPSCARLC